MTPTGDIALDAALAALMPLLDGVDAAVLTAGAIFVRISAIVFLLPGFGERIVPVRVRLGVALAFAAIAWAPVMDSSISIDPTPQSVGFAYMAEAICGLLLGLMIRLMVFALQTAGFMAAQSLSLSQMFGPGVAPDPEPTIATMLTLGGVALAVSLGLHIKATILVIDSYSVLPLGQFPVAGDLADLTVRRVADTFNLAVSIAMPFLIVAFIYNVALGLINKAMPQMMVAFVGLPLITWAGIMLLMIVSGAALTIWHGRLDDVLAAPLGL